MKKSIFNYTISLDNNKNIIYNTLTHRYKVYNKKDKIIKSVIKNMNSGEYSLEEFELLKELLQKGILISDNMDEREKIKFLERSMVFQEEFFNLTIQPTLNCNFRCTYCYENHLQTTITTEVENRILKFVEKKSKNVRRFHVTWFGGEPMMRFDSIERMSKKMNSICIDNGCLYSENMVTNGYLFNDEIISRIKKLNFTRFQITVDGDKKNHNMQRPLLNGNGTFDEVTENMIKLIECDFKLTFRINVTKDNVNSLLDVLEIVPIKKRKNVNLSLNNLFQCDECIDLFNLYKIAIDKGYVFNESKNRFLNCINECKNSITVEPDGTCSICSCISEKGLKAGYLSEDGVVKFLADQEYIKIKNSLATDREQCILCNKLPICMGGCSYGRYKNKEFCPENKFNGLTLDNRIRLHYYSDLKFRKVEEC